MRVVLDTNVLVSALLIQLGHPAAIYRAWHEGNFKLVTCAEQLDELRVIRMNLQDDRNAGQGPGFLPRGHAD